MFIGLFYLAGMYEITKNKYLKYIFFNENIKMLNLVYLFII